jgi:UDP-glucose:(heptosyl)LPS alpha-1,3-glucosyltransferase
MTYVEASLTGGVERVVVESANEFAAEGHEVHVFASRWQEGVLAPQIVRHSVPTRPRPGALLAWQFRRRSTAALNDARAAYDVHAAYTAFSPLGGVFWVPSVHRVAYDRARRRLSGARATLTALNPTPRAWLEYERQAFAPGGHAHLIAAADDVKADIVERYGVPEDEITVLPLGFDPKRFNAEVRRLRREQARAELGYDAGERVVLFVANELERKGFDTLLEAVARGDDKLLVVGDVDLSSREGDIERLGLRDRVRATGRVADVAAFQAAADVFALPTRYEPWGLVIVEALAAGLPVVTSRLAGASIAVQDGRTGVLLDDPADSEEVAAALAKTAGIGDADEISASVRELSWPAVIRRYAGILARFAA